MGRPRCSSTPASSRRSRRSRLAARFARGDTRMKLGFEVWGRVRRPLPRVFKAVQEPKELSAYFTTGGAVGRLETGKTVMWDFADFPGAFPVEVKRVAKNKSIVLAWGSATGG